MSDEQDKIVEAAIDEAAATEGDEKEVKPKKKGKGKRILIIVAIVLVVLGGGVGIGYVTLHDKPEFCNAVCHVPMDPYVASYLDGTSILESEANSGAKLMITTHKEADLNCLSCHEPSMGEQITEGVKWVTGDYSVPLEELKIVAGTPAADQKGAEEFCLRDGCHTDSKGVAVTSLDQLKKISTEVRNPHNSHMGNIDCSKCHQSHEQSVNICKQCHADAPLPDGWLNYVQYQAATKVK